MEDVRQHLAEKGLKATPQRLIIYRALVEAETHPTAEMVYVAIRENHPSISLGTIYKTLDLFVEAGLASKVKTIDDVFRFDARTSPHHHVFDIRTGQITDYEDPELRRVLEDYFQRKGIPGFDVSHVEVHIHGQSQNDLSTQHS